LESTSRERAKATERSQYFQLRSERADIIIGTNILALKIVVSRQGLEPWTP
jgi:hypothetical protein